MGVAVMPTTLLVSPDGVVVKTLSGTVSADQLTAAHAGGVPGVIDGLFAYAFTTGMLATVNPCGFAMLPAYLSYFLGIERPTSRSGRRRRQRRARRAARWP